MQCTPKLLKSEEEIQNLRRQQKGSETQKLKKLKDRKLFKANTLPSVTEIGVQEKNSIILSTDRGIFSLSLAVDT